MKSQEELHLPEWGALIVLVVSLCATVAIAFWQNQGIEELKTTPHLILEPNIWITVEGAVEHPGRLEIAKGALLKEALAMVGVQPDADTSKLMLAKSVRKNQKVWVPSKKWVVIEVEGMGKVKLPKGTRLNQLPALVDMPEGVERSQFKSRRLLKDCENIILNKG